MARLLFLSHRLPFPPHSGAAIRTYNVLVELSRRYEIDALCFDRTDAGMAGTNVEQRINALRPYARCEVFTIPQQASRARFLWDHVRSVVTGRAYTYFVHDSNAFLDRLRSYLRDNTYDLIHVDTLDLVRTLDLLPLEKTTLTHHNVESELLDRRASLEKNVLRREYTRWQASLVRRAERRYVPRVVCNLCASADDQRLLEAIAPGMRSAVVPNGVDDVYFSRPPGPRRGGLVFVGGTSWHPNRDALEWFVGEILPAIRAAGLAIPVTWVGRMTTAEKARYSTIEGFTATGYVEDVRPYLADAVCFIAPIRFGGGTRLKMLDAWAMEAPVVATRAAMEGLDPVDGDNCLLAETPAEFVAQIRRLTGDAELAGRLARAGRACVEQHFAWRKVGADLRSLYATLSAEAS
jgi:glycosyltransferase involved in cell wall biosynthesis